MCPYDTYKIYANGMTCQYNTLSTSNMLTITNLANYIIYGNLYHINIFQNTHLAAYDITHMHTPPKIFIQLWMNVTQMAEIKTRGLCG